MTENADLAEARVHHHVPRQPRSSSATDEVGRADCASGTTLTDHLQTVAGNRAVQRLVQESDGSQAATPDLAARIERAAGGGWSIGTKARRRLERGLGARLDHVRVHDDSEADAMARSVGATAFTTGSDIFFRQGAYQPGSREGLRLLAHESTHVLQQAAGAVDGTETQGVSLSHPSDRFEQAAEANADRMAAGTPERRSTSPTPVSRTGPAIQRMPGDDVMSLVGTGVSAGGSLVPSFDPWGFGGAAVGGLGNVLSGFGKGAGGTVASSSLSTLGAVGSIFGLGSGLMGMSQAKDTSQFIAPALSTVSGVAGLVGGIAGMGGATTGLAALGPVGAAIGLGGGLGALGAAGLWELEQQKYSGTRYYDAADYEGGHTNEEGVYTPPVDWALDKQNKIDAAWQRGGWGGTAEAAYHGVELAGAGVWNGLKGVGGLIDGLFASDPLIEDAGSQGGSGAGHG